MTTPYLTQGNTVLIFDGVEVRELISKLIADSMYAACNESGNKYLMMESIVEYRKNNKTLSGSSQKIVHRGRSFIRRSTV